MKLKVLTQLILTIALVAGPATTFAESKGDYTIGLSMYSLRQLFQSGALHVHDYPEFAKKTFGITQVDVWDGGYPEGWKDDPNFFKTLRKRADEAGSEIFLVMTGAVNATGKTADERKAQAPNFFAPVDQAVILGAEFVRVFLRAPDIDRAESINRCEEALRPLADYAKKKGVVIVIEPGASKLTQQGTFLAELAKQMDHPNLRLMPDFGKMKNADPYGGTKAMMPYTAGVSAKSHDFDTNGDSEDFDYARLMKTINEAGFKGIVSIEYEGAKLPPVEGVRATQKLLQRYQK